MSDEPKNEDVFDNKANGGPAFPAEDDGAWYSGMSLRDYFAAKAMQEVFAQNWTREYFADEARRAYKMADAMLAERKK